MIEPVQDVYNKRAYFQKGRHSASSNSCAISFFAANLCGERPCDIFVRYQVPQQHRQKSRPCCSCCSLLLPKKKREKRFVPTTDIFETNKNLSKNKFVLLYLPVLRYFPLLIINFYSNEEMKED
jgi:hypothetical protein